MFCFLALSLPIWNLCRMFQKVLLGDNLADTAPPVVTFAKDTHALTVVYGENSGLTLDPCASYANVSAGETLDGCWVVAWDDTDGDVTTFLTVSQVGLDTDIHAILVVYFLSPT